MQTHHDTIASDLFDALDRSSQSIYYVIQDGHFVWGNNQGCRVTGLRSREDVFGRPGLTFVHPDDRPLLAEMTRKVMHGEKTVPFEWRLYTVDGNTVWVLGALTRINFSGRPAVLGNYIDITHFKQTCRELKSAYKRIEDLTIDLDAIRREERAQVAWELQENLGVTLKILKAELEGIFDRHLPGDRNRELLIRRIDTAQNTIARGFRHLSPSRNPEEDLAAAIQWYAGELADSTGISVRLDGPGKAIRMEPKQTAALFHIFQEASKTLIRLGRFKTITVSIREELHRIRLTLRVKAAELKSRVEVTGISGEFQYLAARTREWDGTLDIRKKGQLFLLSWAYPLVKEPRTREIRILLGSGQPILMESIGRMLSAIPDLFIAEKSDTFMSLMEKINQPDVDLALLDSAILGVRATDRLKEIKEASPLLPLLVYHTLGDDDDFALRILRQGAAGYLSRSSSTNELISAIHRVAGGRKHISNRIAEKLAFEVDIYSPKPFHHKLSNRERQIMFMIAQGKTMKAIAADLCLSYTTIVTYRNRVLEKMNMKTNTEIVRYVVSKGLI